MLRTALLAALTALGLTLGTGCSHMVETKAINQFTAAVVASDLDTLRTLSSDDFEQKALRLNEAADDLKTLRLPTEELEVLEVKDDDDGSKLVKVEAGKSKRTYHYRLVRNGAGDKWVVDDVFMKQTRDGATVVKTVTEQMDLLLSVREFRSAWTSDDRDRVLSVVTPEFRAVLADLPPAQLSQLVGMAVGDKISKLRIQNPQIDNDVAVVTLPQKSGKTLMTCKLLDEGWRVSDLAVEKASEDEHLPSVLKTAIALRTAVNFLDAYEDADKERLAGLTDPTFYRGSLLPADDLRSVELPSPSLPTGRYQLKMVGRGANLIIPRAKDVVTVSLARTQSAGEDLTGAPVTFHVAEVTIYEPGEGTAGTQEKRLSALFTGRAVMQIFADALARRDLQTIRNLSTNDFSTRVWQKLDEASLQHMEAVRVEAAPPELVSTEFKGSVTEITVLQGEQTLTYVLLDGGGEMRVDDVIIPVPNRPQSLKETLTLLIPVRTFADALASAEMRPLERIGTLQRNSSDHLNRMVWNQTNDFPKAAEGAAPHLKTSLRSMSRINDDRVLITLGDERFGARVLLVREHNAHVIDEVQLIDGPGEEQHSLFKKSLQQVLAGGSLEISPPRMTAKIVQAGYETTEEGVEEPLPFPQPDDAAFLPPPETAIDLDSEDTGDWSTAPVEMPVVPHPMNMDRAMLIENGAARTGGGSTSPVEMPHIPHLPSVGQPTR